MDAVVALSEHGARAARDEAGVDPERAHVIPHGAFDYLTRLPDEVPLPDELAAVERPWSSSSAWSAPTRASTSCSMRSARSRAPSSGSSGVRSACRWNRFASSPRARRAPCASCPASSSDRELPAYFRRADLVVLPHRDAEQSGVLYAALAFGKPIVMSDVGGFAEVAAHRRRLASSRRATPTRWPSAIEDLLADPEERERLAAAAAAAAAGPYSWERVAAQTLALYAELGA